MQYVFLYLLLLGWVFSVLVKSIRDSSKRMKELGNSYIEDSYSYAEPTTSKGHPLTNIFKDV